MKTYVTLHKHVGQTPLDVINAYKKQHPEYAHIPMAYAGRLDPMASGILLILIGEECKQQERYHALDKEYVFEVLFSVSSDTGDVLGLVSPSTATLVSKESLQKTVHTLRGAHTLPYPHFSSKTVRGKPLHVWTLENRLDEITIPTYTATVYSLSLIGLRSVDTSTLYTHVVQKIESIPKVTDPRKALGNDFRREDVRNTWQKLFKNKTTQTTYQIATIRCISSSGMYMRTLAELIAKELGTCGLAFSIERTKIGHYLPLPFGTGIWTKKY